MTTYLTTRNTSPWFLAVVVRTAPGNADPTWNVGRHVYCRTRAGLIDVRGEGGVYVRLTVGQAAARLRRLAGADGRPRRVGNQQKWCEECGEFWQGRQVRRQDAA